jgi:hypothetical protein
LFLFLLCFSSVAWGRDRVVVLELSSSATLPRDLADSFRKNVIRGLEGAGFEVVSDAEVKAAFLTAPELKDCQDPICFKPLGTALKASRVIDGRLVLEGNNYSFTLRLLDLAKNQALSQENSCDVCNLTEAAETLSIAASSLVGRAIEGSPQGKVTRVFIESLPPSEVFSQRKSLGLTPLILELPVGEYEFVFEAQDFARYKHTVALRGEETTEIKVDLQPKRGAALLKDKQALWGGVVLGTIVTGTGVALFATSGPGVQGRDVLGVTLSVSGLALAGLSVYQLRKLNQQEKPR